MATPHVAGLAALILSVDSSLSPSQVRNIIESTAEDKEPAGRDDEFGFGIIDANAALSSLSAVSIILTSDGVVEFGILPLGGTADSTGDAQVINISTGPANIAVRSTVFSDGSNTWDLGSANGVNQVKWEFSPDAGDWNTFLTPNILYSLANNVAEGDSQNLYLRVTTPTETSSPNEHSATVTFVATTP